MLSLSSSASSRPRPFRRALGGVVAMGLLASACVQQGAPGVKVNPLTAQLVFGVKGIEAPDEADQAASLPAPAPLPEEVIFEPVVFDEPEPPPLRVPTRQRPKLPEFEDDPQVQQEDKECYPFFTKPAPRGEPLAVVGNNRPTPGMMRWNGVEVIGPESTAPTALDPNSRLVQNVKPIAPGQTDAASEAVQDGVNTTPAAGQVPQVGGPEFTYEMVQPFGEYFLVTTYQIGEPFVTPNALQNLFTVSSDIPRPRPPESGVVLKRSEVVNVDGQPVAQFAPFEPTVGLMLLPLPATASERFVSVAVDPATGKVIRHDGSVKGISRINACGEPVDGWQVSISVLTMTPGKTYDDAVGNTCKPHAPPASSTDAWPRCFQYDVIIAPQHGGLLISEAVTTTPHLPERTPDIPVIGTRQGCTPIPELTGTTTTTVAPGASTSTTTTGPVPTTAPSPPSTLPCVEVSPTTIPGQEVLPGTEGSRHQVQRILGRLDTTPAPPTLAALRTAE